jgi:hypothetical protein
LEGYCEVFPDLDAFDWEGEAKREFEMYHKIL